MHKNKNTKTQKLTTSGDAILSAKNKESNRDDDDMHTTHKKHTESTHELKTCSHYSVLCKEEPGHLLTAELPISETQTKNKFADEPEGLRLFRDQR